MQTFRTFLPQEEGGGEVSEGDRVDRVPDYFQLEDEDSLRQQVRWLRNHAGCDDTFFSRLLQVEELTVAGWLEGRAALASGKRADLLGLWRATLHMLSFVNFEEPRLRQLLEHVQVPTSTSPSSPPWMGSSIKSYLERLGPEAIEHVERWIMAFRFGDTYATPHAEDQCLSSPA